MANGFGRLGASGVRFHHALAPELQVAARAAARGHGR